MEEWKGHGTLLQALEMLADDSHWICWFVGGAQRPAEEHYLQSLKEMALRRGIGNRVRFLGQRSDVDNLLAAADLYCQPNQSPEAFGITFIEALYAGLPVVTSAIGGALEIMSKECGMLVPPDDPRRLSEVLCALIGDRRRLASLGAAGPSRAAKLCDPAAQIAKLSECLSDAVRVRAEKIADARASSQPDKASFVA